MSHEKIDEDAIDREALQAQIDLSMSFAQDLISSWLEPHKLPSSSRRNELENELAEYMKRPPRLGVGASIPEGHQSSRETARLKGKLLGSKRPRGEEDAVLAKPTSDDEGESRAGSIAKRARPALFGAVQGKKKKKQKDAGATNAQLSTIAASPISEAIYSESIVNISQTNGVAYIHSSPSKVNKGPKEAASEQSSPLETISMSGQNKLPAFPLKEERSQVFSPSTPIRQVRVADVPLTAASPLNGTFHKHIPADLMKRPLLNLGNPPSDQESCAEPTESPTTSPKKKRKRKKKSHTPISTKGILVNPQMEPSQ